MQAASLRYSRLTIGVTGKLGAFVETGDEGSHFAQAGVDGVELGDEGLVRMIDAVADGIEIGIHFVPEFVEFLFGEELGFEGRFAHELFSQSNNGEGSRGADQPRAKVIS